MTNHSGDNAHQKLFPPYVPQAYKHGIGIRAAGNLLVNIDPYPNMDEGDLIELYWGGCYVASKLLTASDIGHTLVLRVPESFLQNGTVKTHYRLMKVGGTPLTSTSRRLRVKLDMPGGLLLNPSGGENQGLAPVSLPEAIIHHGLDISQMAKGLPLSIEPYLNMATCDEITLRWGDVRMDLAPLVDDNLGKPIRFVVPGEMIREAGDEPQLEVTYCVIDRVGNNSRWAPPREITVSTFDNRPRYD